MVVRELVPLYRLLTRILLWAMIKLTKSLKVVLLVVNRHDSENDGKVLYYLECFWVRKKSQLYHPGGANDVYFDNGYPTYWPAMGQLHGGCAMFWFKPSKSHVYRQWGSDEWYPTQLGFKLILHKIAQKSKNNLKPILRAFPFMILGFPKHLSIMISITFIVTMEVMLIDMPLVSMPVITSMLLSR